MSRNISRPLIYILLTIFLVAAFLLPAANKPLAQEQSTMANISPANNRLAFMLYQEFRKTTDSFSFSPTSISAGLSILLSAAEKNTADEIAKTLQFTSTKDALQADFSGYRKALSSELNTLRIATSLWSQEEPALAKAFIAEAEAKYGASVTAVDFKTALEVSREKINTWVAKESSNKITELFQSGTLTPSTTLVLTNVVYFKGLWATPFEKTSTSPGQFHESQNTSIDAKFMNQSGLYNYAENSTARLLELPYAGNDLSLLLILPTARFGLAKVEDNLNSSFFNSLTSTLEQRLGNISIPRFNISSQPDLQNALLALGMKEAFSSGADFSKLTEGKNNFYLASAVHKSVIEVNEEGTEAAAATGFVTARGMPSSKPLEFRADEPFLFLIYHKQTNSILFIGRINKALQ